MSDVKLARYVVNDGMDWGEFFVSESAHTDGINPRWAVTVSCVTSYGNYGHHWSHCGNPAAVSLSQFGPDYLLGKIATRVFDEKKFARWINHAIFTSHATAEEKREAARRVREYRDDYGTNGLGSLCYADPDISRCEIDWSDPDSESHDPQAVMMVKRLWPKFTERLRRDLTFAVASAENQAVPEDLVTAEAM